MVKGNGQNKFVTKIMAISLVFSILAYKFPSSAQHRTRDFVPGSTTLVSGDATTDYFSQLRLSVKKLQPKMI